MAGYKRVGYYELCRLCTSTESTKVHLFKEEGRRRQLPTRIKRCLPLIKIQEHDILPKMICSACATKLEEFDNFRNTCFEAEKMLRDFRLKLKTTMNDTDNKLEVYVRDSPLHSMLPSRKKNPPRINNDNHTLQQNNNDEADEQMIAVMAMHNRVNEPVQCSVPLKLNGVTSSVVPINVENLSSLMQIVPNTEMPRIQKFNMPLQTELTSIDDANNPRYSITLRHGDSIQKDAASVLQSLQCAVAGDKMSIQSAAPASSVPYSTASMPISLISSSPSADITENTNLQEVVMQVNLRKDDPELKSSCSHCGKILSNSNEICDHNMVVRSTSNTNGISRPCVSTSVIQSNPSMFSPTKETKWSYLEEDCFKCDVCEKPFRKKEHLCQHRKLHTGVRPYVCGSCGKSFSRKEHLYRHMLAHTGERRFACNLCGKTFSRKDNLHKHRRTHGITGPYECELCGKSFIVKHYFLMHQANHAKPENGELPFQCDICKKGFMKEEFLNTHKVRHRVRMIQPALVTSEESVIAGNDQLDDDNLSAIDPVALLSPDLQQNCSDDTIYISTHAPTFTLTSTIASNATTATQTPLYVADLGTDNQLLGNYGHVNSTTVST